MLVMGIGEPSMAQGPIDEVLAATHRLTDKKTSATAFLVWSRQADEADEKRPVLVTAAHAFERMPGATVQLVLRAENADSTFSRREADIALRKEDKPLWVRHPELDIAALPVELPEGTVARPLRFEQIADASWTAERRLRVGADVLIPGYPATLEGNDAGWPVLRRGIVATHPLTPVASAQRMLVNATTFGGDSGAPVVLADGDEAVVVGIVVGMQRQTDRSTMAFEERVSHMPLGLAITIQAPFIRDTMELLAKTKRESEVKPEPEAKPEPEPKPEPEAKPEPKPEPEAKVEAPA